MVGAVCTAFAETPVRLDAPTVDATTLEQLWTKSDRGSNASKVKPESDRLARAQRVMLDAGITRAMALGQVFLWRGGLQVEAGQLDAARGSLAVAQVLMPGAANTYQLQAAIERAKSPLAIHRWLRTELSGLSATLRNSDSFVDSLRRWMTFCALLALVLSTLFILGQLCRYGLHIVYGIGSVIPGAHIIVSASFILVFAGLVTGVYGGAMLLLAMTLLCLLVFQTGPEKVGSFLCLGLMIVLPMVIQAAGDLSQKGTAYSQALQSIIHNPYAPSTMNRWRARNTPGELSLERVLIAAAAKRRGAFAEAVALLPDGLLSGKGDATLRGIAYNTKGNAFFGIGDLNLARKAYEASRTLIPSRAEPAFNLSRLLKATGDEKESEALRGAAVAIDSQAVLEWSKDDSKGANRYVVEISPDNSMIIGQVLARSLKPFEMRRSPSVLFGVFGFLAGIVLMRLRGRLRVGWPCVRCGLQSPMRVADVDVSEATCDACTNIFLRSTPIDRRIRLAKEIAVGRYSSLRRWFGRIIELLLPGVGASMRGHFPQLMGTAVLLCLAVWHGLFPGFIAESIDYWPKPSDSLGEGTVSLVCVGVAYAWSLASTVKTIRKERAG